MGSVAEIVDAKEVIFSNTTKISDSFFHIFVILKLTVTGATRRLHHSCHRFHDESQTVKSWLQECKQMIEILWEGGIGNKILCFFAFVTRRLFFLLISMVYISLIGRYLIEIITLIMQKNNTNVKKSYNSPSL